MEFLKNMAGQAESLAGNTKKAILVIQKKTANQGEGVMKAGPKGAQARAAASEASKFQLMKSAVAQGLSNDFHGMASKRAEALGDQAYRLTVQYNPSSLSLRGNSIAVATDLLQKNIYGGCGPQAVYQPSIIMTVELIFDAMNPQDCFMMDKGGLSVGSAVSTVADVANTLRGKEYSVLPQTNALMSILTQKETKNVTFCWNRMSFTGIVSEAQAAYTMFNTKGSPVRSTITLMLNQELETKQEMQKVYRALTQASLRSGRDAGNVASNLLGLNSFT